MAALGPAAEWAFPIGAVLAEVAAAAAPAEPAAAQLPARFQMDWAGAAPAPGVAGATAAARPAVAPAGAATAAARPVAGPAVKAAAAVAGLATEPSRIRRKPRFPSPGGAA